MSVPFAGAESEAAHPGGRTSGRAEANCSRAQRVNSSTTNFCTDDGTSVVVDVSNSPSFEPAAVLEFFTTSTSKLLAAEKAAGVGHHVALSIVGIDRSPDNGYFKAKIAQEKLIEAGPIPYSIVRATQFMEFVDAVLSWTADGDTVRLPATPIQPIAAKDVAAQVARVAEGAPLGGVRNVAGPEVFALDELGRITLDARPDGRAVVTDETAGMFALAPGDALLAPADARIAPTRYRDWLA